MVAYSFKGRFVDPIRIGLMTDEARQTRTETVPHATPDRSWSLPIRTNSIPLASPVERKFNDKTTIAAESRHDPRSADWCRQPFGPHRCQRTDHPGLAKVSCGASGAKTKATFIDRDHPLDDAGGHRPRHYSETVQQAALAVWLHTAVIEGQLAKSHGSEGK